MSGQETSPQSPSVHTGKHRRPWTSAEDAALRTLVGHFGDSRGPEGRWKDIAAGLQGRTAKDCRKRWFHSLDPSLRKGRWTAQEDELLLSAYARLGPAWHDIAALIPGRKDDQCSKRYNDILDPSAKNRLSDWTAQEDNLLRQGVASLGHRWAAISSRIPGRPPLTCRNRWRTLSRQSHSRQAQSKSQGTTPSSSASQMSPMDSGVSPAPQNLNLDLESASASAAEQIMSFSAMEAEAGRDQTGPSFLDSAFYETFAGPSPPSLHDTDTGENTEKENGTGVASDSVLLGDLSTGFSDQTQTAPKQWTQQPRALHTRHRQDSTTGAIMPSPSSWSSMSSMVATGTSPPTDQNLWLGAAAGGSSTTAASSAPKNWGIPDESLLQSYTESFQLPQTTQQTDSLKNENLQRATSNGDGEVENTSQDAGLQRGLAGRHLMMLAIGGVIGPGYFVGMGTGLSTAGPAGLLLCFSIVGVLLWAVMQSLGELGAFIPMSGTQDIILSFKPFTDECDNAGSFTHYTSMFVDPAVGFALGWNYWFLWAGIIIAEYSAHLSKRPSRSQTDKGNRQFRLGIDVLGISHSTLGLDPDLLVRVATTRARYNTDRLRRGIFLAFTFLGIKSFGEAEYWLALIKVLAILAFFLCAILITSGVIGGEKIGFKFYNNPGAFADGVKGVFKIFVFAALQYSGTEMIGLTAGESKNPARDVPRAVKSVLWRIVGIFLLGIFFLTLTVPYNDENLLSAKSKTARSPFVIAFTRVGATAGAHVVNAIILITMFSAINSALYVGSRTLYGLAIEGLAPKIFCWTNERGVPAYSLILMNLMGFLSLLNLSSGAGVVYTWIVSMTGVATFITWGLISLNHIRFRMALKAQNISTDVLPFQAPAWKFCAYLGLAGNVFFVFFQGWTSFAPWDVEAFFMNYIIVLVFFILAIGWKITHKTKFVTLKSVDFGTARLWNIEMQMRVDAEAAVAEKVEEKE
ncbi:hypothetical protein FDECE_1807 [Fusarium decemcellulare]|nr:hypothetical protein FDECE_1807 [Fusarium decemcellulare]